MLFRFVTSHVTSHLRVGDALTVVTNSHNNTEKTAANDVTPANNDAQGQTSEK